MSGLLALAPEERYRELLHMPDDERRTLAALPPAQRFQLVAGLTPRQRETVMALAQPQW